MAGPAGGEDVRKPADRPMEAFRRKPSSSDRSIRKGAGPALVGARPSFRHRTRQAMRALEATEAQEGDQIAMPNSDISATPAAHIRARTVTEPTKAPARAIAPKATLFSGF